eukprot:12549497-Alexandrium_andersonii.AAC.1
MSEGGVLESAKPGPAQAEASRSGSLVSARVELVALAGDDAGGHIGLRGVARDPRKPAGAGEGRKDAPPITIGPAGSRPGPLRPTHRAL